MSQKSMNLNYLDVSVYYPPHSQSIERPFSNILIQYDVNNHCELVAAKLISQIDFFLTVSFVCQIAKLTVLKPRN